MNALLQNKMSELVSICRSYRVEKLAAFGSVCTDKFNSESDVDLLVSFGKVPLENYADNYFELKDKIENLLSREVDLVEEKTLTNPYFIKVMNKTLVPVYGR